MSASTASLKDFDIIEDLKPIGGGWRYMQVQRDGSLQRIPATGSAQTGRALVEQVRTYRINEGLAMGDPVRDVADYIRRVSPNNDRFRGKGAAYGQPREEGFVPLIQRLREWIDSLGPKKPMLLTKHEATERAQKCVGCPQNVKWKTNCGECVQAIEYLGSCIRGTCTYELDDALLGCRLHNLHLPTAVFIDRDFLPAKHSNAPAACWLPDQPTA